MKNIYKEYLFTKKYIVADIASDFTEEEKIKALFFLAHNYGILIDKGEDLISRDTLEIVLDAIQITVPDAFYRNFPMSVKLSTPEERLLDQLIHYTITYGFGKFDEAGHSLFEQEIERSVLSEATEVDHYSIITESEANDLMLDYITSLLASSRPLSDSQYSLVKEFILDSDTLLSKNNFRIASKSTAIKLLLDIKKVEFLKYLNTADILKVVETMILNRSSYRREVNLKKLNLSNSERKLISEFLDIKLADISYDEIKLCSERKKLWAGLLHHIHYKAKTVEAAHFVEIMRGAINVSDLSKIESYIDKGNIKLAVITALNTKGSGFVLRNLTYYLSRCKTDDEIAFILESTFKSVSNPIILLQLLVSYKTDTYEDDMAKSRNFMFVKNGLMKSHSETDKEVERRKSLLKASTKELLVKYIEKSLAGLYKNKLGNVYFDDALENYALPIYMSASNSGVGTLSAGSRIKIEDSNVRAFTYWEKVNDIDLSCFILNKDTTVNEISWRTYNWSSKSNIAEVVTFSGDQTSGYRGGSEFFDIKLDRVKEIYPKAKYIVFCDNVYSGLNFDKCYCKAGYMLRKDLDAGQVYEPKTVKSSFIIDSPSTMCYLFAIDLDSNELVWLNLKKTGVITVAGTTELNSLYKYLDAGKVINYKWFFTQSATQIVDNIDEADIIVSDNVDESTLSETQMLIRGCDFEKMLKLID